ncbi:MAG TPA: hypothetical protein VHD15_01150 [Hyphomicrobiales bacterium]|nr:hypothetical protein [Hyphomicrobiales bacterium]
MAAPTARPLRLVVHVGPHKTGTTYLQSNFSRRAAELRARGWLYPALGERIASAQHDLAESGAAFLAGQGRAVDEFRRVLGRADAEGLNLLLSSEGFRRWRPVHYDALAALIGPRRLHFAYTLRDPLDRLHSAWAQRVKAGAIESLPQWIERHRTAPPRWSRLDPLTELRPLLARADATCTVLRYDALRDMGRDLFVHFLDAVLGLGGIAPARRSANERLPVELTEFLRLLAIESGHAKGDRRRAVDPGFVLSHLFRSGEKQAIVAAMQGAAGARRTLEVARATPQSLAVEARLIARAGRLMSPPPSDGTLFSREPVRWTYYDAAALKESPEVAVLLAAALRRSRPTNPAVIAANLGKRTLIGWRMVRKRFRV